MPTYDYRCLDCGIEFERFQSMKDDPLTVCPDCKGKVKRLIGAGAGIIFKGSGFYETDYKRSNYKKEAEKETKTDSGTGDGTATKPNEPAKKTAKESDSKVNA